MNDFIVLAAETTETNPGGGLFLVVIQIGILGLLLYFMMIRPQKKQQKQMRAMLSTLDKGDSVLTSSGFYGVVIDVMDEVVIVEFGNNKNCRIPMKKGSIVEIDKASSES